MGNAYYFSPEWYQFKDFIKALAGTTCEYCHARPARDLHHVIYLRFGAEHPADVMLLCDECHALLHHRFRGKIKCKRGSPFDDRLFGGELIEYMIEKRDREWTKYKAWLERLYEVTGDGADLIAQGEEYISRCENGLPAI